MNKCEYGCSNEGLYEMSNGKLCCSSHYNKCPNMRKKNSNAIKKAYKEGRIKKNHLDGHRGWNKGLTKETDKRVKHNSKSLIKKYKRNPKSHSWYGRSHIVETKNKMSISRSEYLQSDKSHVEWFIVNNGIKNIKVQGTWELKVANRLNDNKIKWDRRTLTYSNHRKYTPDFYIIDNDVYIEVKGFMYEKDKLKMWKVKEEHDIIIKMIEDPNILDNFDIKSLNNFKDIYPKKSIDKNKFNNLWESDGNWNTYCT